MVRPMIFRTFLFALTLAMTPIGSAAQEPAIPVTFEVLPGWRTAEGTHMAGFQIRLAQGWKTYWRAPGDAGIPPRFDWSGSENLISADFLWPAPKVFYLNDMRSIGYHDGLVLPVEFTLTDPASAAAMRGTIELGVCKDICIPVSFDFEATLPVSGQRDAPIVAALVDRPLTAREAGAGPATCTVSPLDIGMRIEASLQISSTGTDEVMVIEAGVDDVWASESITRRAGGVLTASADFIHQSGGAFAVDRSAIRLTILGSDRVVEVLGCTAG